MPVLFAVTLFVSASLLFMVQPMIGRMILPLLGGSPAAWNTCMVFFQMVLLLGYLYAHKLTEKLAPRRQVTLHLAVLAASVGTFAVAVLLTDKHSPIAVISALAPQSTSYPMFGVLALLAVAIGIPFFAVSTSAPLLQRWFAYSGHPAAKDPYFLYAASNAGSLLSLLAYPLITEPSLRLVEQAWLFAGGFVVLLALIAWCGTKVPAEVGRKSASAPPSPPPTWPRVIKWVALAFVPSSLMLGVTTYMTTDIASIPLLWAGPLALYLLTFIIAFGRTPAWFRPLLGNVSPVLSLLLVFILCGKPLDSPFYNILIHLVVYFFAALMCHNELAHDRPPPEHLTGFYLWISVGGMLGGVFNALVAPVVFPLAYEYPIAIAVGCMLVPKLMPDRPERTYERLLDYLIPACMLVSVALLTLLPKFEWYQAAIGWLAENLSAALQFCRIPAVLSDDRIDLMIKYALPTMVCFFFIDRPIRFGLCVAAVLFVGHWRQYEPWIVRTERSFFGILKVEQFGRNDEYHRLVHGTTLHGTQLHVDTGVLPLLALREVPERTEVMGELNAFGLLHPWQAVAAAGVWTAYDYKNEPLTYYHRNGPVGDMFRWVYGRVDKPHVAMVGLGTGSVSCYAGPGQKLTFYEIDPMVEELVAKTDKYFTYVTDARKRGAEVEIVLGDARLKLEEQTDRKYPLLLVDAFSSDSIPVHLLTKEAVQLYMDRVTPDGVVALHISNKYVSLDYVVAKITEELGMVAREFSDGDGIAPGKTASSWVVVARTEADLGPLAGGAANEAKTAGNWRPMTSHPSVKAWTDDYADVLSVMMIKEIQQLRHKLGLPTVEELR